jgi:type VI secretion system protein VasD
MPIRNTYLRIACAGWLAAAGAGCRRPAAPAPTPAPARYEVRAAVDPAINRGPDGQPLSVVVRCYQLKDRAAFTKLSFDQAACGRPDAEILDGEVLSRDEWVLVPGQDRTVRPELLPGARYVGLVGLFRRPDPQAWRCLFAVEAMTPAPAQGTRGWKPWRRPAAARPAPTLAFRVRECALEALSPAPEAIPGQVPGAAPACQEEPRPDRPGARP